MIDLSRRRLLTAGLGLAAAPFIVEASSLMHVRTLQDPFLIELESAGGIEATAEAIIIAGQLAGTVITNGGSGYTEIPIITISRPRHA